MKFEKNHHSHIRVDFDSNQNFI